MSPQGDLCARRRPELHLSLREHVEHPAGYGLDGDGFARSHRHNGLHLAESGLHLLEARVRGNDEVIHIPELGFDLGLPVRRKLRVREKGPPEWSPGIEMPCGVTQCPKVVVVDFLLEYRESAAGDAAERVPLEIQKRPLLDEFAA